MTVETELRALADEVQTAFREMGTPMPRSLNNRLFRASVALEEAQRKQPPHVRMED